MNMKNANPQNPKNSTLEALDKIKKVLKNSIVDIDLKYNNIVEDLNDGDNISEEENKKIVLEEIDYAIGELQKLRKKYE